MPEPIPSNPDMLSESDRSNFSQSDEQKKHSSPEFQDVNNFEFEEVPKDDPDFEKALSVFATEDEPIEQVIASVKEKLVADNWFLREYWSSLGLPKEQIQVEIGDRQADIYNFSENFTDEQSVALKKILSDLAKIGGGVMFDKLKYILFSPNRPINRYTGKESLGNANWKQSIEIYPKGTQTESFRIEGVSALEHTIIHEYGHILLNANPVLFRDWQERFGWHTKGTDRPERCVSEYAKNNFMEDFAESFVAALRKPEILDPEKLSVINELIDTINKNTEESDQDLQIEVLTGQEMELPKVAQPVKFKREKPRVIFG